MVSVLSEAITMKPVAYILGPTFDYRHLIYVGVLISFWLFLFPLFLFAAQPREFFLDGLTKLERSHKYVELRGEYVE
jgi:hypothetical protein